MNLWRIVAPKYEPNIVRISTLYCATLQRTNFCFMFWEKWCIINSFWNLLTFKVWVYWEGHKIWKNLCHTFDESVVFCAHNSVLVKKLTKIFQINVDKSYYTNFNNSNTRIRQNYQFSPKNILYIFWIYKIVIGKAMHSQSCRAAGMCEETWELGRLVNPISIGGGKEQIMPMV